ncbi:hypothetical protein RW25_21635 [Bacillus sp. L_1B0_8]|uniref:Uncharacterized protein n=2 Tax=Bacillus thuringiensis TaxID=1428 RepID=A0A9X7AQA2_BACTU|nr:hypothetical protein RW25_21635 [Bacillus sp. L_1B0_8]KIQ84102.1 hypothetical protein RT27_21650 [Bacillus sp. L_1B0_5]OUB55423.1 hypothetical protein BK716_08080 [Bacillus thuringiensis serovar higo]PEM00884.1 hypothetical protein CN602_18165 [Bacillus cereus]PFT49025.1 hypothetical protein COK72_07690 [Bacillus thuringiensis]
MKIEKCYRGIVINQENYRKGYRWGINCPYNPPLIKVSLYDQPATQEQFQRAYVNLLKEIKGFESSLFLIQN